MRYAPIYQQFLAARIPLIVLVAGGKQPAHAEARFGQLRSIYEIEAAVDWAGMALGAATRLKGAGRVNPSRFVDLDIDRLDPRIDLTPFPWRVRREGQTDRAHYWFRLARGRPMKTVNDDRGWDLMTWNTVMPGSIHRDGSTYLLEFRVGDEWQEWDGEPFSVALLPCLDPHRLLPPKPSKPKSGIQEPNIQFAVATGSPETISRKVAFYLSKKAPPSVPGHHAREALLIVTHNLRLYYRLSWTEALYWIRVYYDPRCTYPDGSPYPWTTAELSERWELAGQPGAYATLARDDPKTCARKATRDLLLEVAAFLAASTIDGGTCEPLDLLEAFVRSRGGESVSATAFGRAVHGCTGRASVSVGGHRMYQGFHLV